MKPVPIALRMLVASALAATAAAAAAQDPPALLRPPEEPGLVMRHHLQLAEAEVVRTNADAWRRWADDFSRDMRVSMSTMYGGRMGSRKTVKGAPYSADVVTEMNQTLGDGNVITKTTTGRVYRDGEGRTRQESGGDGKNPTIYISDPVEKKDIVLTPGANKAIVTPRHDFTYNLHRESEGGGHRVIVKSIGEKETGDGTKREEVRIQIVREGESRELVIPVPPTAPVPPTPPTPPMHPIHPMPPMPPSGDFNIPVPPLPGAHTMRFKSTARLGKGTTTALGTKDFDGVKAEGKSTVWVIPAGQIGNKNPIQVTSETWYSPELQLTVYSRHNDPRMGESIYRLAALKRGEPLADLFKAPEDYAVKKRGK